MSFRTNSAVSTSAETETIEWDLLTKILTNSQSTINAAKQEQCLVKGMGTSIAIRATNYQPHPLLKVNNLALCKMMFLLYNLF